MVLFGQFAEDLIELPDVIRAIVRRKGDSGEQDLDVGGLEPVSTVSRLWRVWSSGRPRRPSLPPNSTITISGRMRRITLKPATASFVVAPLVPWLEISRRGQNFITVFIRPEILRAGFSASSISASSPVASLETIIFPLRLNNRLTDPAEAMLPPPLVTRLLFPTPCGCGCPCSPPRAAPRRPAHKFHRSNPRTRNLAAVLFNRALDVVARHVWPSGI